MVILGVLLLWGAFLVVQVWLAREALVDPALRREWNGSVAVVVSLLASLPTFATYLAIAFVWLGGGAATVQYVAGSDRGYDLWLFWGEAWPRLFALAPFGLAGTAGALLLAPLPRWGVASFVSRITAVASSAWCWALLRFLPPSA